MSQYDLLSSGLGAAILITALEALKRAGFAGSENRYAPILSLLLGAVLGVIWALPLGESIWTGILAGLSLAGISSTGYKQVKSLKK